MSGDAPAAPPRSELSLRVMSAVVMVCVALLTLWWGGWPFALLWIAAGFIAGLEWSKIAKADAPQAAHLAYGAAAGAVGLIVQIGFPWLALIVVTACAVAAMLGQQSNRRIIATGIIYASAIAAAPIIVRDHATAGVAMIAWCFAVVWSTDIAAYFTGRKFGGPKLWPTVSPKKTWSGAVGGALAGIAAGLLVMAAARAAGVVWPLGAGATAFWALVCSAAGQLGDLAESSLKRKFGVKDSGAIIPGHGGVLDRLDAFVVVVAIVAFAVLLGLK
jgi:phosphatidate cytidylyltransferase